MPTLNRYIALTLIKGWILVTIIMLALFGLLQFVQELEHTGNRYKTIDAALFVLRTLPQLGLDLTPVSGLLGTLIGLANLSRHSELIAMRAAGVSSFQLLLSVLMPSVLFSILILLAIEFISPVLHEQAEIQRAVTRSGHSSLLKGKGLWSNAGLRFFNVRNLAHSGIPAGIKYYEFEPDGKLVMFAHADHADLNQNREWSLKDVQKKTWEETSLTTKTLKELDIGPFWKKSELPLLPLSTAAMPPSSLYEYARYLHATNQRSDHIELAFLQKITLPLITLAMICLAVPIGAGQATQRTSDFALHLGIGALIGILFYLGSQIIHTMGPVVGLPPALLVSTPSILVMGAAIFLFRRMA